MADVHRLIFRHGIDEARRQAVTKHERAIVEAAYHVLSDEADKLGFTYSGFALTSLPHKPQKDPIWRREGHNLTLLLQSGVDRTGKMLGLPYGSYARFILLFLSRAGRSRPTAARSSLAGPCGCGSARWDSPSAGRPTEW